MTKNKLVLCNQETILKEETKRRKQLRLLQVREISKQNAAKVRDAFKKEKDRQIKSLQNNIQNDFEQRKEEKLEELEDMVYNRMRHFGEGHDTAANYEDKTDLKIAIAIENEAKAQYRGNQAVKVHRVEKMIKENKENAHVISRQYALDQERLRAAEIAKLPPKVDELNKIVEKNVKLVTYHDASAFMTTRYHMPETMIDKASKFDNDYNANEYAKEEEIRIKEADKEKRRTSQENKEKARLRGKHALEKEILTENYENFLGELDVMEKADRERRQKELLNIPKEIFLPPWQRDQEKNEKQLGLEREFEKIYVNADLRQEMPEPMNINNHELSSNFDSELDLTVLENKETEILEDCNMEEFLLNNNNKTKENERIITPTSTVVITPQSTKSVNQPVVLNNNNNNNKTNANQENALNKLLQKIRQQREDSNVKNGINKDLNVSNANTPVTAPKNASPLIQPQTPAYIEISHADSTMTSLETGSISEETTKNETTMMSDNTEDSKTMSNNVSSILNNRTSNNEIMSTIGLPQYSVDLSHASKDPMVAGPKELFQKNDVKLALEERQRQLGKQQKELEEKLKYLQEREKEINYNDMNCAHKLPSQPPSIIQKQQQQRVQSTISNNNNNVLIMSGKCVGQTATGCGGDSTDRSSQHTVISSSYGISSNIDEQKMREYQQSLLLRDSSSQHNSHQEIDINLNIELRKKEILQRFGLTDMTNFNKYNNEKQMASSIAQLSEDKYTISTDSGFASWRNQQQHHQHQHINTIIPQQNKTSLKSSSIRSAADTSFESNVEPLENDNAMAVAGGLQKKNLNKNDINSKLFGLEYFDGHNADIRDVSLEQLIGWLESHNSSSKLLNNKSNSSTLSQNELKQQTINNTNKNDSLYESMLSTSTSSSVSSSTRAEEKNQQKRSFNNSDEDFSATSDDCDDSSNIIMSLLNSRRSSNENNNDEESEEALEARRRLIEEQLEIVRAQKEQLLRSQNYLHDNNTNDQDDDGDEDNNDSPYFILPNKSSIPQKLKPPVKSYRAVECNPHELSTIKEENNTPMSEKAVRRVPINNSTTSSLDYTKSPTKKLTEQILDETDEQNDTISYNNESMPSFKSLSPSKSFEIQQQQQKSNKQSTKNNRVAFNLSLFDPGSSIENSCLISPTILNGNNNNNNNGTQDSSTNLESTTFKTALTNETSYSSIKNEKANLIQKTLKKINNESRKKWIDILSAANDSSSSSIESGLRESFEQHSSTSTTSSVSQGKLLNDDDSMFSNSSDNSKVKSNRKIASTIGGEKAAAGENRLDVAPAKMNLLANESSNLRFQSLNESVESKKMDRSLKILSSIPATTRAIKKEVLVTKNFDKDLAIHKEISLNSSSGSSSQKSVENEQHKFLNDLFAKNASEYESYSKHSLMDEPEISFVSIKTNSNVNSPNKDQISTPATALVENRNKNFVSYLSHKTELFKRFSNISPIEQLQQSMRSSNESSTNKSLKQHQHQQDPCETPIGAKENKNILFKSLNSSEITPQHFQSLIAETTHEDKQKRQNFDSFLSTGSIEKGKIHNSQSKSNDDSHMTIEFENDQRHSSIIEFSQMDNLINDDRILLQTPSYYNEDGWNCGQSESLLSFERHEKSNAEMTTSSSKKSAYLHEETLESDEESLKPIQSSKSPTCNKVKAKIELFRNHISKQQPKPFSKSHQIFPKASELSPCLQKTLKSSLENSKIEDSSDFNKTKQKLKSIKETENSIKTIKLRKGGVQYFIDDTGNIKNSFEFNNSNDKQSLIGGKQRYSISKKEMYERTLRLCRFDGKDKLSSCKNKLEEIKVNKAKLVEYSNYCKQRNKRFTDKLY